MAEKSGTSKFTVSEVERGQRDPHPGTLRKLAKALGVPVATFFEEEPEAPKAAAPSHSEEHVAGSRGEGRLAHLEATTTSILEIAEGLDPAHNPLDRVAVEFLESRIIEITRVLAEKTGDRSNPLASRMRDHLETEGEEAEIFGVATPEKTPRGESKQSQIKEAHEAPRGP